MKKKLFEKTKELDELNIKIADQEAKEIRDKIMKHFSYFNQNPDKIDMQKMWKSLKKISPKLKPSLPCAKRNLKGKIITSHKDIKQLLAAEYKNRLRTRPLRDDLKPVLDRSKDIFLLKMKLSKMKKSEEWTEDELDMALRDLNKPSFCSGSCDE